MVLCGHILMRTSVGLESPDSTIMGPASEGCRAMINASTISCEVCCSVYERRTVWISSRDKGEKRCEVCGALLEIWNGPRLPIFRLLKRGSRPS